MAVGDKLLLDVCCCTLTTAGNIDLTAFNIKPGICWHIEMKSIKTMKSLIYRSNPILAHSKGLSGLLYWNCVLMVLARITDNRNFHYKGICYINEYWYRFLCSTVSCKKYSKKIFTNLTSLSSHLRRRILLLKVCNVLFFARSDYSLLLSQCLVQSRPSRNSWWRNELSEVWYQNKWGTLRIVSRVGDINFRKWFEIRWSLLSQLATSRSPGTCWSSVGSLLLSDHGGLSKMSSTQLTYSHLWETLRRTTWNSFRRVRQCSPG